MWGTIQGNECVKMLHKSDLLLQRDRSVRGKTHQHEHSSKQKHEEKFSWATTKPWALFQKSAISNSVVVNECYIKSFANPDNSQKEHMEHEIETKCPKIAKCRNKPPHLRGCYSKVVRGNPTSSRFEINWKFRYKWNGETKSTPEAIVVMIARVK